MKCDGVFKGGPRGESDSREPTYKVGAWPLCYRGMLTKLELLGRLERPLPVYENGSLPVELQGQVFGCRIHSRV